MSQLKNASIEDLEAALASKREEQKAELEAQYNELQAQMRELEAKLAEHGARPAGGRKTGPRPKNTMNLKQAITEALKGDKKGKTSRQIAAAVQKAGYRSSSSNFENIVYQTLHKNQSQFKRGSDGAYTLAK